MKELNELVELAEKADAVANLMDDVNPHTVLAIADAFQALEQRAEAAEADHDNVIAQSDDLYKRLMAAEEKLAELEKQEPEAWLRCPEQGFHLPMLLRKEQGPPVVEGEFYPVFTRPAPAVSLAELVPDELTHKQASRSYGGQVEGYHAGFNACRAAMLRNIEEAQKK